MQSGAKQQGKPATMASIQARALASYLLASY